jgi:hypothetical protein
MRDIFLVFFLSLNVFSKTDLSGNWVSECNPIAKHSFIARIVFKGATEKVEFKLFEDTKCVDHSLTVYYEAIFITGAKYGEGKKFNSLPTKVQMSVHLPAVLEQFNKADSEDGCGIKNWKLNIAQDVSGKFCRPFKMPAVGKTVYDMYKLNLNSIAFGGLPTKWDMSDPTVRPDKLSKVEFWIEKNRL